VAGSTGGHGVAVVKMLTLVWLCLCNQCYLLVLGQITLAVRHKTDGILLLSDLYPM